MNADIINLFGRFHLSQTCEPPVSVHLLLSYSLVFQTTILNFWRKVIKKHFENTRKQDGNHQRDTEK